jgi:hypothetical protein
MVALDYFQGWTSMYRPVAVDFDAVKMNAEAQGLNFQGIAIPYEGLTDSELLELSARGLGRSAGRPGAWLGRFTDDGQVLFPHKAVSVHTLEA